MSGSMPNTWQEMLDLLTLTAKRDGVFERVTNLSGRKDAVKTCMHHSFYRTKLLEWIAFVKNKDSVKSSSRSIKLRAEGNGKFKNKDYFSSIKLFTESMTYATYNTEEMALAVANRSAALFFLGANEDCLKDIELAASSSYPDSLKYKLFARKGECLAKMNRHKEAIDAFEYALKLLENTKSNISEEKELQIIMSKSASQMIVKSLQTESSFVENCDSTEATVKNTMEIQGKIPAIFYGENENFAYASAALDLRYDPSRGRHVLTKWNVKAGDIIFVEKPFAFVLLPDYYKEYCHHCCKQCITLIPCTNCPNMVYCGICCRESSWDEYHKHECSGGLEVLHSVGIAHLALRVVLKADPLHSENSSFSNHQSGEDNCVATFGNENNNYPAVYSLLPHIENMESDDFFQYAVTATLLVIYLKHSSKFFENNHLSDEDRLFSEEIKSLNISEEFEEKVHFIGRLILRHIAQLICNAHAITKIESIPTVHNVTEEVQVRIATAIYPSVSMMNHSCNPNIISSFCDEYVIVRACREIPCDSEVFNCYGPHFRRMPVEERQEILKSQYFFKCSCDCCTDPTAIERQKHFSAWQCPKCDGPLVPNDSLKYEDKIRTFTCCCCKHRERIDNMEHCVEAANKFYKNGVEAANNSDVEKALAVLLQCLSLREKYLYKSNSDISNCLNQLGKCCAIQGKFEQSVGFLKRVIKIVEEQYGETSIELANELQKLSDVMLCQLKEDHLEGAEFLTIWEEANNCVRRAKAILEINYGNWTNVMQDILMKEIELNSLKQKRNKL